LAPALVAVPADIIRSPVQIREAGLLSSADGLPLHSEKD